MFKRAKYLVLLFSDAIVLQVFRGKLLSTVLAYQVPLSPFPRSFVWNYSLDKIRTKKYDERKHML
jgi:hypothetical protein